MDHSAASFFELLQYDLFATVIDGMAAILLFRTFTGKDKSRFLIHLSAAFLIIASYHVVSTSLSIVQVVTQMPTDQAKRLAERVGLLLSCLSTFFLILSFILLLRYPRQNVPQALFASMTGVLALFVALVTVIQGPPDDSTFLKFIDISTSFGGAVCVGGGLVRIAGGQASKIIGWIAACFFVIWAFAQLPFWYDYMKPEDHQTYFYTLTMIGFFSAVATVIFAATSLPDRPTLLHSGQ